jgi:hypothetical protein
MIKLASAVFRKIMSEKKRHALKSPMRRISSCVQTNHNTNHTASCDILKLLYTFFARNSMIRLSFRRFRKIMSDRKRHALKSPLRSTVLCYFRIFNLCYHLFIFHCLIRITFGVPSPHWFVFLYFRPSSVEVPRHCGWRVPAEENSSRGYSYVTYSLPPCRPAGYAPYDGRTLINAPATRGRPLLRAEHKAAYK